MKLILTTAFFVSLLSAAASVHAQTIWTGDFVIEGDLGVGNSTTKGSLSILGETGSSAAPTLSASGDGGVVFQGTLGTGPIPATSSDSNLIFFAKKSALRMGYPDTTWGPIQAWTNTNIGEYSAAFGVHTAAQGYSSFAAGNGYAYSAYGVAFCGGSAHGLSAFGGGGHGYGTGSAGISAGSSSGLYATAMSLGASDGDYSIGGAGGVSYGDYSLAVSHGLSYGENSTALSGGLASGTYSVALGENAAAMAAYSTVVGRNNTLEGSATTWVETDPLFVVGNGTGNPSDAPEVENRNAFVVYKNGDARFTKRQGDIPMGEFGESE